MMRIPVAIGLGANQGDPLRQFQGAMTSLADTPGVFGPRLSSVHGSRPLGPVAQADFVNAVCLATTSLEPEALLDVLHSIEENAGRTRIIPQGPRTLDLDLLLYGSEVIVTERLEVPHPRMAERGFVLVPLAEIAPDWRHPLLGRTIAELLSSWREEASPKDVWPLGDK